MRSTETGSKERQGRGREREREIYSPRTRGRDSAGSGAEFMMVVVSARASVDNKRTTANSTLVPRGSILRYNCIPSSVGPPPTYSFLPGVSDPRPRPLSAERSTMPLHFPRSDTYDAGHPVNPQRCIPIAVLRRDHATLLARSRAPCAVNPLARETARVTRATR